MKTISQIIPSELILQCSSWQQAQTIADNLMDKKLVETVEFIEGIDKVTLLMKSITEHLPKIEEEISGILKHNNFKLIEG